MAHKTASFVRNELIPESPPPVSETGAVKWMRENLFFLTFEHNHDHSFTLGRIHPV